MLFLSNSVGLPSLWVLVAVTLGSSMFGVIVKTVRQLNVECLKESKYAFCHSYTCKHVKDIKFVNNIVNEGIRVSSLEKTIIDCIDNIDLAGGIEEVLNALEQIKYVNENTEDYHEKRQCKGSPSHCDVHRFLSRSRPHF